ncbi:MAG: hypothetical protein CL678_13645 [Bdellovibrionaceae bacterium]|nr:hypothetical protein [Pseudobdellovibrionaceae bacterium]|tara:strand:+ start:5334 stop:6659 length:1326 start_codon:yes stop_codon:yes gene_type:complete
MITTRRLKDSELLVDWSHLTQITPEKTASGLMHHPNLERLQSAWEQLKDLFETHQAGFFHAPDDEELSALTDSLSMAETLLQEKEWKDVLILGIGGSSLGPKCLLQALKLERKNDLCFHFMENPDPDLWNDTIHRLNPQNTLVIGISKSGGTFESIALLQCAMEWIGESRWSSQIVLLTDPTQGDLRALANNLSLRSLPIHPSIGGRYSIFSPVGLFLGALGGIPMNYFMNGAHAARKEWLESTPDKNPWMQSASHLIAHASTRPNHVFFPYSSRLRLLGDWFVQLWAESLGKEGKGFTPIAALGATDQHSLLQLLVEGPDHFVTFFLSLEKHSEDVKIPQIPHPALARLGSFQLLGGHTLGHLLATEHQSISKVFINQKRPSVQLKLDHLNAHTLGALMFHLCSWTAFTGILWEVDPFNQPGVEEGKVYIREMLSDKNQS